VLILPAPALPTLVLLAACLLVPSAARADAPEELAGLFLEACLPFAGNAPALRDWAGRIGLPQAPEQARAAFLHGAPGLVFDASTTGVKLALVSSDDGICSAATDHATRPTVIQTLEAALQQAGLKFRLVVERDDAKVGAIHDREYLVAKDKKGWRVLAATVKDEAGGEAMLTAAPE
jgi:hypothetical protein